MISLRVVIFFALLSTFLFVLQHGFITLIIYKTLNVLLAGNMMHIYSYANHTQSIPLCAGICDTWATADPCPSSSHYSHLASIAPNPGIPEHKNFMSVRNMKHKCLISKKSTV